MRAADLLKRPYAIIAWHGIMEIGQAPRGRAPLAAKCGPEGLVSRAGFNRWMR